MSELGTVTQGEMEIILNDPTPVVYRPYRMSCTERSEVRRQIEELKANNIIQDSNSLYASPVLLVKKKNGEQRLVVDFRLLNSKTVKNKFPLPIIEDLLEGIGKANLYTTMDCASGFWQIPMAKESIPKTGFVTADGHYEWLKMPFGLTNGPAVFQETINKVL